MYHLTCLSHDLWAPPPWDRVLVQQDTYKMHPGWSKYDFTFHRLITACVGLDSSCPKHQSGFSTPDSFCTLAVVWIVVPEIQPAHLTTHLDSLLSFSASLVPVVPVCYLVYPFLAPLHSKISVCPVSGWSTGCGVHSPLLIWGMWA